ncbi:hypothetical protein Hdeb2414_s0005g00173251 [Helianthus debilis subsp. tardiflorus]
MLSFTSSTNTYTPQQPPLPLDLLEPTIGAGTGGRLLLRSRTTPTTSRVQIDDRHKEPISQCFFPVRLDPPPPSMDKTNHHHHHRVVVSDGWPRIRGERERTTAVNSNNDGITVSPVAGKRQQWWCYARFRHVLVQVLLCFVSPPSQV